MADLNTNVHEVFNDRALLDRVVRSIQLDRDCDYLTALEALHDAADSATNEGAPTLRRALEYASDGDYCAENIKLLERRDTALGAAGKQATKKLDQADELGRVKLSAGKVARILADDPTTVQKRRMRARELDPNTF